MKKKTAFGKNRDEIVYHIINSLIAGAISFLSAIITVVTLQSWTLESLGIAAVIGFVTALLVAVNKFKDYWSEEESEYKKHLLDFV